MMYIILGLVLIAIGLFMVTKPESFWWSHVYLGGFDW